jgi:polyvinyl alcohol dehydrogenase (cytochrome)
LDRRTGCVRWVFRAAAEGRTGLVVSPWKAGDRTANPLVYFGDLLGNVYALRAKSGELVWRDKPEAHANATITAAPTLYQGRLFVAVSSNEEGMIDPHYSCCTFRGLVSAYDDRTGRRLWQTFMIDSPRTQGVNQVGTIRFGPSGAPVWNSPTIDEKRRRLYIGTGDNYSNPTTMTSDAVLALDLENGHIVWSRQMTSGDAWNAGCSIPDHTQCPEENGPDYDISAATILISRPHRTDYLVIGQKSGSVYAVNPDNGSPIWQTKVGRGGVLGGIMFGMAVADDTVVVPVGDVEDGRKYDEPAHPGLFALNLATGAFRWRAPDSEDGCVGRSGCAHGNGQAITIAGDLVLAGGNDGWFKIHDLSTGKVLWKFDTARSFPALGGGTAHGGSMGGAAGPLAYHGSILVSSGYGTNGRMPGNALLMFEVVGSKSSE